MHPVLFNESFYFCPRDDLERLQPLSRSLLDMIVAGSNVLPLRPIHRVDMGYGSEDKIRIFVEDPATDGASEPDYEASILDGDFEATIRHLQNTCIMDFNVGIRGSPFLHYWNAQEAAAFTVVSIDFSLAEDTNYGVLDSIVNHLRPRTTGGQMESSLLHLNGYSVNLELLARESFLNNLQTCHLDVSGSAPVFPPAFFFNEPGYPNYDVRYSYSNAADRIDGLVESFIRDGCTNRKLQSVSIQWTENDDMRAPTPKQLRKPTKTEVSLLKSDLPAWITKYVYRVSECQMHSFVNQKQWQRMDVYKWSVEFERPDGRFTLQILHCRVKNL
ncbi:hypothetical protein AAVH_36419 [Aphelenchoides avenae]|nr:hypothetical protein AAVH_36419 [Aphelenchus avenae]